MVDAKPLSCQHLRITRVWSVGSGRLLRNIVFPTIIDAVALDPGENIFFAGGRDGKIYVAALNARAHLPASMGSISSIVSRITAVTCLAYGISGNYLISGSEDGVVRVWDARTHNLLRMFKHAKGPAFF
ncbi:protein ROOT INITIATION DEFECTIVE 3-like isoform X2 [Malus domestica]|uniref:protein ROOT INITIATION DEFECTIVE 3-like isoform X2 n=1 Tax=Malus domestica TaxID=3750 RepID=UPI0039772254